MEVFIQMVKYGLSATAKFLLYAGEIKDGLKLLTIFNAIFGWK